MGYWLVIAVHSLLAIIPAVVSPDVPPHPIYGPYGIPLPFPPFPVFPIGPYYGYPGSLLKSTRTSTHTLTSELLSPHFPGRLTNLSLPASYGNGPFGPSPFEATGLQMQPFAGAVSFPGPASGQGPALYPSLYPSVTAQVSPPQPSKIPDFQGAKPVLTVAGIVEPVGPLETAAGVTPPPGVSTDNGTDNRLSVRPVQFPPAPAVSQSVEASGVNQQRASPEDNSRY